MKETQTDNTKWILFIEHWGISLTILKHIPRWVVSSPLSHRRKLQEVAMSGHFSKDTQPISGQVGVGPKPSGSNGLMFSSHLNRMGLLSPNP